MHCTEDFQAADDVVGMCINKRTILMLRNQHLIQLVNLGSQSCTFLLSDQTRWITKLVCVSNLAAQITVRKPAARHVQVKMVYETIWY